ncbi:MAG: LysR family transcriptional regulator [Desulfitobacterium sp.]|nr:LysR family transcriptional regulator [Desulfitobacterium sp.]
MDIRHLKYFMEVAENCSFTQAARNLYVSQPAISKVIKNIENELGVILFDRSGKQVVLTDAGKVLYKQAQGIMKSFQNLTKEINDLTNMEKGKICIGLPPMIGSRFFPKVLGQFRELYPNISIQIVEVGAKVVEAEVERGNLDMGVAVLPVDKEIFYYFRFVQDSLKLVVHPAHPLAKRKSVTLSELSKEDFVFFHEDFRLHDRILEECNRVGFEPNLVTKSSQWDFISEMTAYKLGISLLPETICAELDTNRVKVIPLVDPEIPWHLGVIWRKDGYLSYAAREWIRILEISKLSRTHF